MASVVYHTHRQIGETGKMKLFQSHNRDFANGEQKRDFVYIKDVVKVLQFMMEERKVCGLFNLGTGEARTFNDLATSTFRAMNIEPKIEYIPTPEDIRISINTLHKLRCKSSEAPVIRNHLQA